MTDEVSCEVPLWVDIVFDWANEGLITSIEFNNVMQYLINIGLGICKLVEHIT